MHLEFNKNVNEAIVKCARRNKYFVQNDKSSLSSLKDSVISELFKKATIDQKEKKILYDTRNKKESDRTISFSQNSFRIPVKLTANPQNLIDKRNYLKYAPEQKVAFSFHFVSEQGPLKPTSPYCSSFYSDLEQLY